MSEKLDSGFNGGATGGAASSGGKYTFNDNSETPDSQVTVYEFPSYMLVWEHKAGLNNGLQGRPWGVEWSGTEGTITDVYGSSSLGKTSAHKRARRSLSPSDARVFWVCSNMFLPQPDANRAMSPNV